MPAIVLLLFIGFVFFTVFRLILRDTSLAGLFTLAGLMLVFPTASLTAPGYPLLAIVGLLLLAVRILKRKNLTIREAMRLPGSFTYIANTAAALMIVFIGAYATYNASRVADEASDIAAKDYASLNRHGIAVTSKPLPNIVHIVLDGYSRADVLRTSYDFDNAPFLDALRKRGFRVADKATTPFNQTLLVMNSIFSLGAGNDSLPNQISHHESSILRRLLVYGQQNGSVTRILGDLGYDLHSTPSSYLQMQWESVVGTDGPMSILDRFALPGTYLFTYDLLQSSPFLGHLAEMLAGNGLSVVALNYGNLMDVPIRRFRKPHGKPLFVYEHILAPHPPFNITADGRPRAIAGFPPSISDGLHLHQGTDRNREKYRDGYIDKLRYINGAILKQIDSLKETLPGPLVIILHGDHGGGLHFDQDKKSNTCLHERFSPLLAVYSTDPKIANAFTDDFNLVNIYRVIFNVLLNTDLPALPNRSAFVPWRLDNTTTLDPQELTVSCGTPNRTWTAQKPAATPKASSSK